MTNIGKMLKQAQQIQQRMGEMQNELAEKTVEGASGGGMVKATMTGKGELRALRLDPSIIDPADPTLLEDLVIAAVNDARAKMERMVAEEMGKLTGGLSLPPGMKLPF
jgi:hypothetical protein